MIARTTPEHTFRGVDEHTQHAFWCFFLLLVCLLSHCYLYEFLEFLLFQQAYNEQCRVRTVCARLCKLVRIHHEVLGEGFTA